MSDLQRHLTEVLGLDPATSLYFASRKLPEANEYWLKRTSYLSTAPGFVFIPVYFDLLIKQKLKAEDLLTEDLLITMERVLNSAGRLELGKVDHAQHLEECREILRAAGVSGMNITNVESELVTRSFTHIPPKFHSLRRANTFLYTFGAGKFDHDLLFATWELIVPLFLMLDDFTDLAEDMAEGEENCLLDGGPVTENFFELTALIDRLLAPVKVINPTLSNYLTQFKNEAVARCMLLILVKGTT